MDSRQKWALAATSAALLATAIGVGSWAMFREYTKQSIVDLGYSRYQGEVLDSGVNRYLGMRYAAPPVGDLRFRAPVKPANTTKVQSATKFGPVSLSTDGALPSSAQSEDCLFINVWRPTSATPESKLPVWVYIQGGGYQGNLNANYDGSTVVAASGHNIVFVNFNYRVSSFGFLASERVRADGDLNVGLLDQRRALEWVQEHISQFGGDPNHVVAHGVSAGAGSLALHLTAYGGRDDRLFIGAILESPFFPTHPKVSELEWQFDKYVDATSCTGSANELACLRSKDTATLQVANVNSPYPGRITAPRFYWTPTVDGVLIQDYPSKMIKDGKFVKVPIMIGGGAGFAADAATPEEMGSFLQDNYPNLTDTDTANIIAQYPLMPPLPLHAAYFPSLSAAYGETTFTWPGNHISASFSAHNSPSKVWNYRYNVQDEGLIAAGLGVPHTFESPAIFGVGSTGPDDAKSSYATYNKDIVPVVMHYWISFVRTLNPNTFRFEGAPLWEDWGKGTGRRLVFETNRTRMEDVPEEQIKRGEFWNGLAETMQH